MISLENASKFFSGKEVIHSINLKIDRPLIYGLLGPNGAGKTTTIRIICGIINIDSGNILREINFEPQSIGYMPEEIGLYNDMSVIEQILYMGKLHNLPNDKIWSVAKPLIINLGLQKELKKPIGVLSKGTSRKVQFICTLLHSPQFIVLDEPFSGLDPQSSAIMENELLRLKKEGRTIILSTHRMEHAEIFCDHIFIINNGDIIINEDLNSLKRIYFNNAYILHVKKEIEFKQNVEFTKNEMANYYQYVVKLNDNFTYKQLINELQNNKLLLFKQQVPTLKEIFLTNTKNL